MGQYIVRRILIAIPTLLVISFVVFAILELSPSDPVGQLPLTIPPEVREQIREAMGVNDPFLVKYVKWLRQFMINEPLNILEELTGINVDPPLALSRDQLIGAVPEGSPDADLPLVNAELAALAGEAGVSTGRSVIVEDEVREVFRADKRLYVPGEDDSRLFLNDLTNSKVVREINKSGGAIEGGEILPVDESRLRYLSWQTRSPIIDLVIERMPQTLWVVGLSYIVAVVVAVPVGVIQAYKQYSVFDQVVTFLATIGFSVPTFFTGLLFIIVFSVHLKWLPSIYDTTHKVTDFESFIVQLKQIIMPVLVLALFFTALISRHTRSAMLDNLKQDYVRTARSKGISERMVVGLHALRNSLIPVVTLIALGIPSIFQGAIITEQIFRVNGLGQLLIIAIQGGDLPTVQTLTFIFAVLIVFFNIIADMLYAVLDPRIRFN